MRDTNNYIKIETELLGRQQSMAEQCYRLVPESLESKIRLVESAWQDFTVYKFIFITSVDKSIIWCMF